MQRSGDELKLVYPQSELAPTALEGLDFTHFLLQPMDQGEVETANNVRAAICILPRPSQMAAQHSGP